MNSFTWKLFLPAFLIAILQGFHGSEVVYFLSREQPRFSFDLCVLSNCQILDLTGFLYGCFFFEWLLKKYYFKRIFLPVIFLASVWKISILGSSCILCHSWPCYDCEWVTVETDAVDVKDFIQHKLTIEEKTHIRPFQLSVLQYFDPTDSIHSIFSNYWSKQIDCRC